MNQLEIKEQSGLSNLQSELLEKGRDYVLNSIPPEDIHCEEDLDEYPILEYEELYDLMITDKMNDIPSIIKIVIGLDEDMLGEYIDTRVNI